MIEVDTNCSAYYTLANFVAKIKDGYEDLFFGYIE